MLIPLLLEEMKLKRLEFIGGLQVMVRKVSESLKNN